LLAQTYALPGIRSTPAKCPLPGASKRNRFQRLHPRTAPEHPISKTHAPPRKNPWAVQSTRPAGQQSVASNAGNAPTHLRNSHPVPLKTCRRFHQPANRPPATRSSTRTQPCPCRPGWSSTLRWLCPHRLLFLMGLDRSDPLDGFRNVSLLIPVPAHLVAPRPCWISSLAFCSTAGVSTRAGAPRALLKNPAVPLSRLSLHIPLMLIALDPKGPHNLRLCAIAVITNWLVNIRKEARSDSSCEKTGIGPLK